MSTSPQRGNSSATVIHGPAEQALAQWRMLCEAACESLIGSGAPTGNVSVCTKCASQREVRRKLAIGEDLAHEYGLALRAEATDNWLSAKFVLCCDKRACPR